MAGSHVEDDSPLSITSSVAGILTFLVAIVGAVWFRINRLRSADTEYERVKTALKWYKTESEWINDLIATSSTYRDLFDEPLDRRLDARFGTHLDPINGPLDRLRRARGRGGRFREEMDDGELETYNERLEAWRRDQERLEEVKRSERKMLRETLREKELLRERETGMYLSVLEQLVLIETRLLELVNGVESRAEGSILPQKFNRVSTGLSDPSIEKEFLGREKESGWNSMGWNWMPGSWGLRTEIAVQWLPVRTKALDLMRQREALGSRVLFAQNALIGSRLGEQEERGRRVEDTVREVLGLVREMGVRGDDE